MKLYAIKDHKGVYMDWLNDFEPGKAKQLNVQTDYTTAESLASLYGGEVVELDAPQEYTEPRWRLKILNEYNESIYLWKYNNDDGTTELRICGEDSSNGHDDEYFTQTEIDEYGLGVFSKEEA